MFWTVVLGSLLAAANGGLAVVAVAVHPESKVVELANAVRGECARQAVVVIPAGETAQRLRGLPAGAAVMTDAAVSTALVAAEKAYAAGTSSDVALSALERLIAQLEADGELTVGKTKTLQRARLLAAQTLLGIAPDKETGRGETQNGRRARDHLVHVLQVAPYFQLNPGDYPPKMRLLADYARDELAKVGTGALVVRSNGNGGQTVYVEGYSQGAAPSRTTLPRGTYRVWLEQDGRRSQQRRVDVGVAADATVDVDWEFESRLSPSMPGLLMDDARGLSDAFLGRVSALLGNASMALIREFSQDGQAWIGVDVYSNRTRSVARRGALLASDGQLVAALCQFAGMGEGVIDLQTKLEGARVWLDDVLVGVTPLASLEGLAPGRHRLRLRLGEQETELTVAVDGGKATAVSVQQLNGKLLLGVGDAKGAPLQRTPVDGQGARGPLRAWLLPVAVGGVAGAAGLLAVSVGAVVGVVSGALLAFSPRSANGTYIALQGESADLTRLRVGLAAGAVVTGLGLGAVGVLAGLVGTGLVVAGVLLRQLG